MGYVTKYKKVENRFKQDVLSYFKDKCNITEATEYEDIYGHWDLEVTDSDSFIGKVDVKALKKRRRSDPSVDDSIHWVELQNVNGDAGWLFGLADNIAFETLTEWLIVSRTALIDSLKSSIFKEFVDTPEIYRMYRRKGRNDVIVLVPTKDLKILSSLEIPKIN